MSVRTYNPSVRVGNWNEDLCLEEDLLKDFLDKKEKGELHIQKAHNLLQTVLKKVELSPLSSDGYLRIGDKVNLKHIPTNSVVSAFMSALQSHEATQLMPDSQVTGSSFLQSCPRNIFVIGSPYPDVPVGALVGYEDHITLQTLPNEGGQLYLHSDRVTFNKHSKHSRECEVTLVSDLSYFTHWSFRNPNHSERLETEGEPVPANKLVLINHCKTNHNLALNAEYRHKTPYGLEYEITACTKFNKHKVEDTNNQFMIVTGEEKIKIGEGETEDTSKSE
ncbi:PREDICTED: cilia- and flagella-associated protein 161-like [Amphimedon queenslandica]|uniref:Cilia- and flagella-associated protein 161 n=1 Tax=Amphimedon queenslandica TaxID=400682 RepID=A0A1X7UV47_AMPQE|nr:PREDICTED: cilia- and flagella-associated protein 161-like [Amphimedon queenslandica]|eukprot:XP_003386638.1 PREDICTED: cilia- and flagella-associated protein 161-like [Amphimedon queenslandica]